MKPTDRDDIDIGKHTCEVCETEGMCVDFIFEDYVHFFLCKNCLRQIIMEMEYVSKESI